MAGWDGNARLSIAGYRDPGYQVPVNRPVPGRRIPEPDALGVTNGDRYNPLVVRQAVALVGTGVAAGVTIALLARPRIEPMLYDVSPQDPRTLVVVALTMLGIGVVAAALPAARATRVNPSEALRSD